MTQTYTARVWKEDGLFIAQCAEIDIASDGKTEDEALANLREALELYLEPPTATVIPKVSSITVEVGAP
jgi:predicted RNase H-like HicB family nuclease